MCVCMCMCMREYVFRGLNRVKMNTHNIMSAFMARTDAMQLLFATASREGQRGPPRIHHTYEQSENSSHVYSNNWGKHQRGHTQG